MTSAAKQNTLRPVTPPFHGKALIVVGDAAETLTPSIPTAQWVGRPWIVLFLLFAARWHGGGSRERVAPSFRPPPLALRSPRSSAPRCQRGSRSFIPPLWLKACRRRLWSASFVRAKGSSVYSRVTERALPDLRAR